METSSAGGDTRELGGLRAGNDYEFFQPIHPDDIITAHWKVKDVYEKEGRSGASAVPRRGDFLLQPAK